jgi:hypothetical protein
VGSPWVLSLAARVVAPCLVAMLLAACTGDAPSAPPRVQTSADAPRTASPSEAEANTSAQGDEWKIGARIQVPRTAPFQIAIGYRYVWVLQRDAEGGCSRSTPCSLSRIDPRTNRVVGTPTRVGDAWGLTVGAGSVWITQFDGRLLRVDEGTGHVQARIRPPSGSFGIAIAFGGDSVWTSHYPSQDRRASLVRIDPATNRVSGSVDARIVDARTQSMAFGNGALWLVDHDHFLVKVNPTTLQVLSRQELTFGAVGVIATQSGVFLADPQGGQIVAAGPETGHVLRATTLEIAPIFPALGAGSLWAMDESAWGGSVEDDRVFRIDPETLRISQTLHVGANAVSLAFGHSSAWVALRSGAVVRLTR